jgi:hypothetical protein
VSGTNLGPATNFSPFIIFLDTYGFVVVRSPFWREVGSVVFSSCSASPTQSFSGLSLTGLMSIFYCPNLRLSQPGRLGACIYFPKEQGSPVIPSVIELVEVEVHLRPTVSLGVRRSYGTRDQFFFLLEISFRQLRICYFVAPSLTRGRVCNLL